MRHLTHPLHVRSLLLLTLLGGIISACSALPSATTSEAPQSMSSGAATAEKLAAPAEMPADSATENRVVTDAGVPQAQPQLVKTRRSPCGDGDDQQRQRRHIQNHQLPVEGRSPSVILHPCLETL